MSDENLEVERRIGLQPTDAGAMVAAGLEAAQPTIIDHYGSKVVVHSRSQEVQMLADRDRPPRQKWSPVLHDVDSFCMYVLGHLPIKAEHSLADSPTKAHVYFTGESWHAILDHRVGERKSWHEHRVKLLLRLSDQVIAWQKVADRPLTHDETLAFLEDHLEDILEPASGDILDVIAAVRGTRNIEWTSAYSLETGAIHLQFAEVIGGTSREKETDLPNTLVLAIPLLAGQRDKTHIQVKLRYRLNSSGDSKLLSFIFHFPTLAQDISRHIEWAHAEIAERLSEHAVVLRGVPE